MSEIKRYELDVVVNDDGMTPFARASEQGQLVLYSDHEAELKKKKDDLIKWLEKQIEWMDDLIERSKDVRAAAPFDHQRIAYKSVLDHLNKKP